jgi:type I restriction enzyme, S subunit
MRGWGMSEWKNATISEFAKVKGGKRLPAGRSFSPAPTPFPYLRVTDMVNGSIRDSDIVFVPEDIEPIIRNYKISKDDIYVTIAGTLGNFGTIPDQFHNAQLTENAAKITEFQSCGFDKQFLKYSFISEGIQSQIRREIGVGGGVPKLALYRIEKLSVLHPTSIPEQRKIASILSTVDAVIEKTEAAIAKYKAIKSGMMRDLFTRGIDLKTGKLRPSYEDAPELYKQSDLGWVPREWEVVSIGESCLSFINGGTPSTKNTDNWKGTIPWVTGADFLESFEIGFIRRYINQDAVSNSSTHVINGGNILLVTRTGVGKLAIAPFDIAISQDITGLILDKEMFRVNYFFIYLQLLVEDFKKMNQGTSINGIVRHDLESTLIIQPCIDEQEKVAQKVFSLDRMIADENDGLHKYQQLKAALMSDLLTGKVRVKYNDETAEAQ